MSAIVIYARVKEDKISVIPMFLLSILLLFFSSSYGELISFRGLTGNKPAVSNATTLTSIFISRDQAWTEELNFRCELRKDDYAVNGMAKGKFRRDCLSASPLGVVPQMMGKLSSCYCAFNLTICDKQIEVKNCVLTGPSRRNTHGSEYSFYYHIGFRIHLDGHMIDGRLDILTGSSDLPRNLSLAEEPAAIMASEFTGWAYRVEIECFAIRSSGLCKSLSTNLTKSSGYRTEWELVAVIFGMAASYVVACIVAFYSWLCKKRSNRMMQEQISFVVDQRRQQEQFVRFHPSPGMIDQGEGIWINAHIRSFSDHMRYYREPEKRLSTYV